MLAKIKRIDWSIVLILLCFMAISTMLIFSATIDDPKYHGQPTFHTKTLFYYGFGFFCLFCVTMINYKIWLKISGYFYALCIVLLIGLFKFGTEQGGAVGWYSLPVGGLQFQPAELMKLVMIFTMAALLARRGGEKLQLRRDVIPVGLIVLLPFLLVVVQPDLGNAIIFIIILLAMYWIGNIKLTHVLIGTALVVGCVWSFVYLFQHYHEPITQFAQENGVKHWVKRFDTFLNPAAADVQGAGYQQKMSRMAIGSGYLSGDGYLKGTSIHNNFIPVARSDAIFVVVAEEFGFMGSAVLLVLYFILIYRMIVISMETDDLSGSYAIAGIVSLYVFQIFENVGMLLGLMPLTGITLPFISYGGTSLLINMIAIGIVLSVKVHQKQTTEY